MPGAYTGDKVVERKCVTMELRKQGYNTLTSSLAGTTEFKFVWVCVTLGDA